MSSLGDNFDQKKIYSRDYKAQDFNIKRDLISNTTFENRKCTDMFCCLIFTIFIVGMAFCTGYGY